MAATKSIMRTIHHFACSGGTVISKCIQSMHSTIVISEVNPDRPIYRFNPFDPVQLMLSQTKLGYNKELRNVIFRSRIKECASMAQHINMNLVLRDHTHSDYCLANNIEKIHEKSSMLRVINEDFDTCSLVTIRNPLEAYISLRENGWDKNIKNFSDYSDRLNLMLDHYKSLNVKVMRYEDFCADPIIFMKKVCNILQLDFNPSFQELFYKIPMTGDSGRGKSHSLKVIEALPQKNISDQLMSESQRSASFRKLADEFGYDS